MMRNVEKEEILGQFPALYDSLARGENLTITEKGVPTMMLTACPLPLRKNNSQEAVDTFFAYVKKNRLKLEGLKIRDLIEEGRRY